LIINPNSIKPKIQLYVVPKMNPVIEQGFEKIRPETGGFNCNRSKLIEIGLEFRGAKFTPREPNFSNYLSR
jgi:hypothetical protein